MAQFPDAEVFGPDLSACDETIEGHLTRLSGPNCSRCGEIAPMGSAKSRRGSRCLEVLRVAKAAV